MSSLLTADQMARWLRWLRWRNGSVGELGRYFTRIDVASLVDHITLLTTVITDLADADAEYQAARGDAPSLEAMVGLGQAMSALHDVAKVIR